MTYKCRGMLREFKKTWLWSVARILEWICWSLWILCHFSWLWLDYVFA